MANPNVWNLMYELGRTGRTAGDSENPQRRRPAFRTAIDIAKRTGWHVWVEHAKTGERIYDSATSAQKAGS